MSSVLKQTGDMLPADECKGFFEQCTEGLVEYYKMITGCKDIQELSPILKDFIKGQIEALKVDKTILKDRLTALEASSPSTDQEVAQFATNKAAIVKHIKEQIRALSDQIIYLQSQLAALVDMDEELFNNFKSDAEYFLTTRQKILDQWAQNYQENPLVIVTAIDGESVAVTADGRDLSSWVSDFMQKITDSSAR